MRDRSQWPCGLRRKTAVARLLGWWVESCRGHVRLSLLWVLCVVRYRSLRQADHFREESYRMWTSDWVWSWSLDRKKALALPPVRFTPDSYLCLSLGPNWLPQLMCFPLCSRHLFTHIHNGREEYSSLHFVLYDLKQQRKDDKLRTDR